MQADELIEKLKQFPPYMEVKVRVARLLERGEIVLVQRDDGCSLSVKDDKNPYIEVVVR